MGISAPVAAGEGAKAAGEAGAGVGAGAVAGSGLGAGLGAGALDGITAGVLADGGATLGGLGASSGLGAGAAVGAGALGDASLASIGAGLGSGIAGGDALGGFAGSLAGTGGGLPSIGGDVFLQGDGSLSAAPGSPTFAAAGDSPTSALGNTSAGQLGAAPTSGTSGDVAGSAPVSQGPIGGAQFTDAAQNTGQFAEGTQAPDATQGSLSSMYGPNSTAVQSPMGQAISGSTGGSGGATMGQVIPDMGSLGQGTPSLLSSLFSAVTPSPTQVGTSLFGDVGKAGLDYIQQQQKQRQANSYANSISQLYAPNSPYAQQMQQTLARSDAANGRNSQMGTRAVQLAAALTQGQAQALGGNNYSQASQNVARTNALNGLFAPSIMNAAGTVGKSAYNGLSGLFSSPSYSF